MSKAGSNAEPLVRKLAVGSIYVTDLDRARAFYQRLLGLEFLCDMAPGVLLSAGDSQVYLEGGRSAAPSPELRGVGVSLCFDCASVSRAAKSLRAAEVTFVEDYKVLSPDFAMFRVLDPDGNVVELVGKP